MSAVMRAISIRQPWAWLVAHGHKPVENRTWPTNHRGDTLIHAGKLFDADGLAWVLKTFPTLRGALPQQYELGGIVGVAHLVGCVQSHTSSWFVGPYGFTFYRPRALPFVPLRGELGFFRVDVSDQLHAALHASAAGDPEEAGQSSLFR